MSVSSEMRVRRRVCRVEGCAHLAVSYERECFDHVEAARMVADRLPPVAVLEEERDRRIRLDDAEFVRGLGRMLAPGLALAIAHWENGPHVGVCGYGACTRTQVAGSPYCRLHGGLGPMKLPELVEVWVCEGVPPRGRTCGTVLLTKSGKDFTWVCPVHKNTDVMCLGEMPMPKQIVDAFRENVTS